MKRRFAAASSALLAGIGIAALIVSMPSLLGDPAPASGGAAAPAAAGQRDPAAGAASAATAPGLALSGSAQDWSNEECLLCHGEQDVVDMAEENPRPGLVIAADALAGSVHADFDCIYCHEGIDEIPHPAHLEPADPGVCASCHDDAYEQYASSVHGSANGNGDGDAPTCSDCHGTHDIRSPADEASSVYPFALPETCGKCHGDERIAQRHAISIPDAYQRYVESVHGRGLLRAGLLVSAACNDCHSSHAIFPAADPRSPIHRDNVPETCGKCHQGILTQYRESIHGTLLADGNARVPTCVQCHTTHAIPEAFEPSFVAAAVAECGNCHADKLNTYRGTYHGKVNELGFTGVAACSSCHTSHHILPEEDPRSSIAAGNLVQTCNQCHPGANAKFAGYIVHADPTDFGRFPLLFTIYFGMLTLLSATMVGATAHTALWYRRLRKEQRASGHPYRRAEYWEPSGKREFVRFNVLNRTLHLLVMLSFLMLVVTGVPLHFAGTTWAGRLVRFFGGFRGAGLVHRTGAIIMVVYVAAHLGYLVYLRVRKGERGLIFGPDSLLPRYRDLQEFAGQVRWFFGRGPQPEFGRWTYWEKFDYFADAWGVIVFGTTGMILWYPVFFTRWLPGWAINVAIVVHGIEALLALSFIFTVHFFNAHLRPGKFPLDPVFLTGRITIEELEAERPREYKQLVRTSRLDEQLVGPSSPLTQHYARVIGYTALAVGLLMVAAIVLSVLISLLT